MTASHPRHGSMALAVQRLNAEHQLLWFCFINLANHSFFPNTLHLQPLTPTLHPTSGVLIAYSAFSTPSLPPALGWIFNLCRRKGGSVGRAAAPISCGENGSQPQSGSWSGLQWATQRQRGPGKKVRENMQNTALKTQRLSFPNPLL